MNDKQKNLLNNYLTSNDGYATITCDMLDKLEALNNLSIDELEKLAERYIKENTKTYRVKRYYINNDKSVEILHDNELYSNNDIKQFSNNLESWTSTQYEKVRKTHNYDYELGFNLITRYTSTMLDTQGQPIKKFVLEVEKVVR